MGLNIFTEGEAQVIGRSGIIVSNVRVRNIETKKNEEIATS